MSYNDQDFAVFRNIIVDERNDIGGSSGVAWSKLRSKIINLAAPAILELGVSQVRFGDHRESYSVHYIPRKYRNG